MPPVDPIAPPRPRTVLVVLILSLAAFMQMLDGSILATAIPQMARSFAVSPLSLGVGITAYVMASAILLPASGWMADRVGARRLFIVALLGFTAASILCGLSRTLPEFVAARVLQGLGGAMLGPVGSVIMMRMIERRDLIRMVNIFSAPMLVAPVLGPPIGGLITTYASWPWIFFLNVPVGLVGAVLALRYIPVQPRLRRPFDKAGFLINGAALGVLIYGFGELTGEGDLSRAAAGVVILVGLGLAAAAVRHARRPQPLLSLDAMRFPTFTLVSIWAMPFMRLPIVTLPFALPIMLQVGFGMTAFASGMLFLAHTLGDLMTKLVTSRVFRRFGYRRALLASIVAFAVGTACFAFVSRSTPMAVIAALLLVTGWFRSILGSGMGTLSYAEIAPEDMAGATTLNQVVMQLVQAIGISLTVLVLDLAITARGGSAGQVDAGDCRAALVIMAVASLGALIPILRLAPDAGAELSGHRRPEDELRAIEA